MMRDLMFAGVLLLAAPAWAQDFDAGALYDEWKAEESRTLEGWRALDDPSLLEKLGPLGAAWGDEGRVKDGDARANALLAVAYRHGTGGAPKDRLYSRRYLAAVQDSELAERVYLKWSRQLAFSRESIGRQSFHSEIPMEERDELLLLSARGFAAAAFLLGVHHFQFLGHPAISLVRLNDAADAGCLPAMVMAAQFLTGTFELKRDVPRALGMLDKAAEADYVPALMELARLYHPHTGQFPDLAPCRENLVRAARAGHAPAAAMLNELPEVALEDQTVESLYEGFTRHWGAFVTLETADGDYLVSAPNPFLKKYPGLADYLRPYANPRNPDDVAAERIDKARTMLGACLLFGIGGAEVDEESARHWLFQVFKQPDSAPAELLYAGLRLREGGENAESLAGLYIRRSAEGGFAPAIRMRARYSLDPTWKNAGIMEMPPVDDFAWGEDLAVQKLKEIAEAGDVPAMLLLARRGLADDDTAAYLRWVKLAGERGHPESMLALARSYKEGNVINQDVDLATRLYRKCLLHPETHDQARAALTPRGDSQWAVERSKTVLIEIRAQMEKHGGLEGQLERYSFIAGAAYHAARAGDSAGEILCAICKLNAHGITRDEHRAKRLLLANNDNELASFLLGTMMEAGRGGYEVDVRGAVWIYKAAADVGAAFAAHRLGEIYRDGRHGGPDSEKAFKYFKKGAEGGCLPSMIALAQALQNGDGAEADSDKAMKWISKAADEGSETARALKEEWEAG